MKIFHKLNLKVTVGVIIIIGVCVGIGFSYMKDKSLLSSQQALLTEQGAKVNEMQSTISDLTTEKEMLMENLSSEQEKSNSYKKQLSRMTGKFTVLEKLQETDSQLLQKYSKVYFLNEHYAPAKLSIIDPQYTFDQKKTYQIYSDVLPRLTQMLDDAAEHNVKIKVVSAYRSFGEQAALKSSYKVTYGSGANKFSADQGYSEHQLGTTVDLTTPALGANFDKFASTDAYTWLTDNAYRFGFILSYPKGNSYYQFEPWHWRFVGNELARKLHDTGTTFYGTDQRTLDTYLLDLFD